MTAIAYDLFGVLSIAILLIAFGMAVLAYISRRQGHGRPRVRLGIAVGLGLFGGAALIGINSAQDGAGILTYSIAGLFALLALTWFMWSMLYDHPRGRRRCRKCWYDMSGTDSLRCSECGRVAKRERQLFRTRRHWRLSLVALMPLAFAGYIGVLPKVKQDGWASLMPTTALVWALRGGNSDWPLNEIERRTTEPHPDFENATWVNVENLPKWQIRQLVEVCIDRWQRSTDPKLRTMYIDWLDRSWSALDDDPIQADINDVYIAMLHDATPGMRAGGAYRVAKIFGSDTEKSISFISPLLDDSDPFVRQHVLLALARTTEWSNDAIPLIAAQLDDDDLTTRCVALDALRFCPDHAVYPEDVIERVRAMAEDPDEAVRRRQIQTLADMVEPDEARELIARALEQGGALQRDGAMWALYSLAAEAPTAADRLMIVSALSDDDPSIRSTATWMIDEIGFNSFRDQREALKAALDPQMRPDTVTFIARVLESFDDTTANE